MAVAAVVVVVFWPSPAMRRRRASEHDGSLRVVTHAPTRTSGLRCLDRRSVGRSGGRSVCECVCPLKPPASNKLNGGARKLITQSDECRVAVAHTLTHAREHASVRARSFVCEHCVRVCECFFVLVCLRLRRRRRFVLIFLQPAAAHYVLMWYVQGTRERASASHARMHACLIWASASS